MAVDLPTVPSTESDPFKIASVLRQLRDFIAARFLTASTDNAAARFDGTAGALQDSALLIADTTGALSRSGGGGIPVQGTNTNDNASAGNIGEYAECKVPATSTTVTISNASPAVITWASHPFSIGAAVRFTTTGALPTGLTAGTTYYVSSQNFAAGSFCVSTSVANALAGTSVNTSSAGSGTHTGTGGAAMTTNVTQDIGGISLTAGDWDVWVNGFFQPAATTVTTAGLVTIALVTTTLDPTMGRVGIMSVPAAGFTGGGSGGNISTSCGPARFSLASTTTVFFTGFATFTTSTMNIYGLIAARRAR